MNETNAQNTIKSIKQTEIENLSTKIISKAKQPKRENESFPTSTNVLNGRTTKELQKRRPIRIFETSWIKSILTRKIEFWKFRWYLSNHNSDRRDLMEFTFLIPYHFRKMLSNWISLFSFLFISKGLMLLSIFPRHRNVTSKFWW